MVPRAAVCAERIAEVLDTESSVAPPRPAGHRGAGRGRAGVARRASSSTRARRRRCCATSRFRAAAGPDHRDHRQHRRRQDHAAVAGPAAVRRHRRRGARRRRRRARARPRRAVGPDRPGAAAAVPVLRHGRQQPALRQPGRHRRGAVGRRWRSPRPATSSRRCRTGSTRRSPRAAPTSPAVSASGWRSPGRWSAGRRSTCSTTRSRRSTSPPTPGCGPRCARSPRDAAVVIVAQRVSTIVDADQIVVLEDGAVVGIGRHDELLDDLPDVRGDRRVPADGGGGGMSDGHDRAAQAGTPSRPPRRRGPAPARRPAVDGRGHAGREGDELRAVGQAAAAAGCARTALGWSPSSRSASPASALTVIGPKILGHATDIIFAGVIGRQLPAGHHRASRRSRRARAAGNDNFADMLARMDVVPGVGHRLRPRSAGCCCWRWRCSSAPACSLWLQGYLLNGVVQRTDPAAARATSRTSCTGCRCPTSTASRAASCSAGSPTTSTTSRRACSRR